MEGGWCECVLLSFTCTNRIERTKEKERFTRKLRAVGGKEAVPFASSSTQSVAMLSGSYRTNDSEYQQKEKKIRGLKHNGGGNSTREQSELFIVSTPPTGKEVVLVEI